MRSHRRHSVLLLLVLGVTAFAAQLAGVGTTQNRAAPRTSGAELASKPGAAVPDVGSTTLASAKLRASVGDVVQMQGTAQIDAPAVGSTGSAQIVCGIRYSRSGDASWSLGDPYETVVLRRGASETIVIERSFEAPATDEYAMSTACHVAAPSRGATVTATGSMRARTGLPEGAAIPLG